MVKSKKKVVKQLEQLSDITKHIIYKAKTVFPFDLFPNTVILDINKLSINYHGLIRRDEFPVLIEDVKNIQTYHGLFFSTLRVEIAGYETNPPDLTMLWPEDANRIKRYVLALLEAKKRRIDLTVLDKKSLQNKLEELGKALEA